MEKSHPSGAACKGSHLASVLGMSFKTRAFSRKNGLFQTTRRLHSCPRCYDTIHLYLAGYNACECNDLAAFPRSAGRTSWGNIGVEIQEDPCQRRYPANEDLRPDFLCLTIPRIPNSP